MKSWWRVHYPEILLACFGIFWTLLALRPHDPLVWGMENALTILIVSFLILTYRPFRLSDGSYTLIALFLVLHTTGAFYTYAEVPFGEWLAQLFGGERNSYDRIVHFSFGLLLSYPVREVFLRIATAKGFWSYWLPIELTLALSALYEMLEWWIALLAGNLGANFVATQGDPWDAQKDMLLATLGSAVMMGIVAMRNHKRRPSEFWRGWKESLRIRKRRPYKSKL